MGWLLAWLLLGCAPDRPGPYVVLLTLDTFRADGVGPNTPNLQALSLQGATFDQALSLAPLTGPSHASMLTGLTPQQHGVVGNGRPLEAETVATRLRARAWRTGAFLSSRVLNREMGFCQGFDRCDERYDRSSRALSALGLGWVWQGPPTRPGDETLDAALDWLDDEGGPTFVWIHLYDAHWPYAPPQAFRPSAEALREATQRDRAALTGRARGSGGFMGFVDNGNKAVHRLNYAAELAWVDSLVGRLLQALPPEAALIVAGDHGEGLGEHGESFVHGGVLTEEALRVPLYLRWPGLIPVGVRHPHMVGLQRVGPTLMLAAGQPPGGPTLIDALRGDWDAELPLATSGQRSRRLLSRPGKGVPAVGLRLEGAKALRYGEEAVRWVDLEVDPEEVWPRELPVVLTGVEAELRPLVLAPLGEEVRRGLEVLGYFE